MALVIFGRRASSGRPLTTSIAAELPIVVFGPASLTLTATAPTVANTVTEDETPAWLPEGALFGADLMGDAAWDGAEAAISDILGTDPLTATSWFASSYNAGNRTSEGLTGTQGTSPAIIGDAKAKVLAGSTIVIEWYQAASYGGNFGLYIPDEATDVQIRCLSPTGDGFSIDCTSFGDWFAGAGPVNEDAVNRMAVTLTPARGAISVNGSVVDGRAMGATDFPVANGPFAWFRLQPGITLRGVFVLDEQLDAALPALSTP